MGLFCLLFYCLNVIFPFVWAVWLIDQTLGMCFLMISVLELLVVDEILKMLVVRRLSIFFSFLSAFFFYNFCFLDFCRFYFRQLCKSISDEFIIVINIIHIVLFNFLSFSFLTSPIFIFLNSIFLSFIDLSMLLDLRFIFPDVFLILV